MKKILITLVFLAGIYFAIDQQAPPGTTTSPVPAPAAETRQADDSDRWLSGQQVRGEGTVSRVLPDDNDGSRHQRFIVRMSGGRTLLIAHNIDLAPRISSLREGDTVSFYGQYESNDKGGVIHWTHHDPQGRHADGWLKHDGRLYQ